MSQELARITPKDFGAIFAKLSIQLRWIDADAASAMSYYEVLRDIPLDVLQQSAINLATERGRKFFPTTGEWRGEAERVRDEMWRREDALRLHNWTVDCTACDDVGWEYHKCPDEPCGRTFKHAPHDYVTPCPCRPTNRTFQRHHAQRTGGSE